MGSASSRAKPLAAACAFSSMMPEISALRRRISSMRSMAFFLEADTISVSGRGVSCVSTPISLGVKVMRV